MKNIKSKILTVASAGVLVAALNVTGVFGTFFTTVQPSSTHTCSGYGYQAGYGYGYDCTPIETSTPASQGLGEARGIDVCPGNIDNSGDFYDRTCDGEGTPSANTDNSSDSNSNSSDNSSDNTTSDNTDNSSDSDSNTTSDNTDSSDNSSDTNNSDEVNGETDVIDKGDYVVPESTKGCPIIKAILNDNFNPNYVNTFVDINNSPYKQIIINFAKVGIVHGTTPTTFEPNRGITRAEFLAIVIKTHCYKFDLGSENPGFPDVNSASWQSKVVKKGVALGIIHGYSDGTFKPNRVISKAEAYGIVSNMGILSSKSVENVSYTDLEAKWQESLTKKLEYLGVLNPSADGYKFHPNAAVNRDEMLNFINNVISLY